MPELLFDRLGHVICPVCERVMRLSWLETTQEAHRGEHHCAECNQTHEVYLRRTRWPSVGHPFCDASSGHKSTPNVRYRYRRCSSHIASRRL
jgi:hypothetical protein